MQQLHHSGYVLTWRPLSIDTVIDTLHLWTTSNIEIGSFNNSYTYKRTGTYTQSILHAYEVHINDILITENPQLVMLLAIHLKNEIKLDHVQVTFVNLSNDPVQMVQDAIIGPFNSL